MSEEIGNQEFLRLLQEMPSNPRFLGLLQEMRDLHLKKSADYGRDTDPLSNLMGSEGYGIPAWIGAMIRANDKVERIKTFVKKGSLKNESVEDSLMDLAAYALIALVLRRMETERLG